MLNMCPRSRLRRSCECTEKLIGRLASLGACDPPSVLGNVQNGLHALAKSIQSLFKPGLILPIAFVREQHARSLETRHEFRRLRNCELRMVDAVEYACGARNPDHLMPTCGSERTHGKIKPLDLFPREAVVNSKCD